MKRMLRILTPDDALKTMMVDEGHVVQDLITTIFDRFGIANHQGNRHRLSLNIFKSGFMVK